MIEKNFLKSGKRVLFTIFTQGLLSVAAIIMGFGLPKFLSVEEPPWNNIKRATIRIVLYQAIGLGLLLIVASCIKCDFAVVGLLVFSCIPTVLMCILSAVLLAGNKTYDYNLLCLIIRLTFVVIMIIGICASITSAEFYMWADSISKIIVVLIVYIYERRYIPKAIQADSQKIGNFIRQNCTSGIIIASTVLLLGLLPMCGRVVIQLLGDEIEYAMFSFAISMLSIILTFTNAIGTVAFPMLKNTENNGSAARHHKLKKLYDEILWVCLWAVVVINVIVENFLHEYVGVLEYFPILLAVCWPLGKVQDTITFAGLVGMAVVALLGVLITYLILDVYFEKKVVHTDYGIELEAYIMLGIFLLTSLTLKNGMFALVYGLIIVVHLWITMKKEKRNNDAAKGL